MLPGDVTADEVVDRRDALSLIHGLGAGIGDGNYNARLDVNFNGQVDLFDLREMLRRLPSRLPSGEPSDPSDEPARIAVDAFFERLGNAPSPAAHAARRNVASRSSTRRSSAPQRHTTDSALKRLQAAATIDRAMPEEPDEALHNPTISARRARRVGSRTVDAVDA